MGQPVLRRGEWWYEQPDGSWLKWNEAAGAWEPQTVPAPPPDPSEAAAAAPQGEQAMSGQQGAAGTAGAAAGPSQGTVQPAAYAQQPASQPQQGHPRIEHTPTHVAYEPAPGGPAPGMGAGSTRPPADQLIVGESYVVSTQQRTAMGVQSPVGDVEIHQVAPNVMTAEARDGARTQVTVSPLLQVHQMAAQKLSAQEMAAAQRRLEVLAGCLSPGEHVAGMAMGTEQATGHAGVIAVTDRQIAFIGQPGGETQLFCPLDDIELVGYESLGGAARMSVTAQGRVTTWRDIIPIERAAEISQLIENKGAMAKAVAPPMAAMQPPIGTQVSEAQPPPTSVTSTGGVSVQRYGPAPSEIVLPEARPEPARPAPSPAEKPGLMDRAKSFVRDLGNDPGTSPSTDSSATPVRSASSGLGQRNSLRLMAGGSILVGLLATALGGIVLLWVVIAAVGIGMGVTAYQRNRRTIRDSVTEGLAIGGIIVGGLSLLIALTQII